MKILPKSLINPETLCFSVAILLYALFSSPTPDQIGWVEGIIGALLCLSCIRYAPIIGNNAYILIALGLGLFLPILTGAITGNEHSLILRDSIAFIFLLSPLLFYKIFENDPKTLLTLFIILGIAVSTRAVWPHVTHTESNLLYLANTAGVLFTASFAMGKIFIGKPQNILFWCVFAIPPVLAMALTLQRASLAYLCLVAFIIVLHTLWKTPKHAILPIIILSIMTIIFWTSITHLANGIIQKTYLHGGNMRIEELKTVWNLATSDILYFFFGQGWGTTFQSPAVANIRVNFTHNLISSTLLKTGVIGLSVIIFYGFYIGKNLLRIAQNNTIFFLCIAGPLFIQTVFYAGFKSLDFGLLLLLILVYGRQAIIENPPPST